MALTTITFMDGPLALTRKQVDMHPGAAFVQLPEPREADMFGPDIPGLDEPRMQRRLLTYDLQRIEVRLANDRYRSTVHVLGFLA